MDALKGFRLAHSSFYHQAFFLDSFRRKDHPDRITRLNKASFQKFYRLNDCHLVPGTFEEDVDSLRDIRMDLFLKFCQCLGIRKNEPAEFMTVDFAVWLKDEFSKIINHGRISRSIF